MRAWRAICAAAAALAAPAAMADIVTVYVFDFEFSTDPTAGVYVDPTIQIGDTVRWVWNDVGHNAKSVEGSAEVFDSGFPVNVGATFEHTFTQTGTYWYYCVPHGLDNGDGTASGMAGTVTVVPEPATLFALAVGLLTAARKRGGRPR